MRAFIANAVKNSRTSSVSKLPIFGAAKSTFQTRNGRPDRSSAARTSASSIGSRHDAIAPDAALVAQRLVQRLAQHDADILDRVMVVDVQVALGMHRQVENRVARQLVQHVIEEPDARAVLVLPGAVEVERHRHLGLGRLPRLCRLAHRKSCPAPSRRRAPHLAISERRGYLPAAWKTTLPAGTAPRSSPSRRATGSPSPVTARSRSTRPSIKSNARKVRRISPGGHDVVCGFAGATADAFTLLERLEGKLEKSPGNLMRACVELAKDWRTDRYLRNLQAMLIVTDGRELLVVTGNGDVLEPEGGIAAIGSGGNYALAAARALAEHEPDAETLARKALEIAASICVFTNGNATVEVIDA